LLECTDDQETEVPNHLLVNIGLVYSVLRRLKTTKSPGPDGIPNRILKTFAFEFAPVMIYIDGSPVQSVSSFKLLGVLLREDLSWCDHVDYVIKKANSRLYALRKLKKAGLSDKDLVTIYSSFIRSRIEYTSPAWSTLTQGQSDLIESIQRRALRILLPKMSYQDALNYTGLKKLIRW
jgi:hypothetical protein